MDAQARTTLLINQVVAWHNRHPLARRITRDQVGGVGTVALPFVGPRAADGEAARGSAGPASVLSDSHAAQEALLAAAEAELIAALAGPGEPGAVDVSPPPPPAPPDGAALPPAVSRPSWHPAAWAARWQAWRSARSARRPATHRSPVPDTAWRVPVFSENFVPPLRPAAVARWARRHAGLEPPTAGEGPLREVPVDSGLRRLALRQRRGVLHTRFVSSAAIEIGPERLRCLIGPVVRGRPAAILGPRAWDPRRVAVALGLALGLVALLVGVRWWSQRSGGDTVVLPPASMASAAQAATSAAAPASVLAASAPADAASAGAGPEMPASAPDLPASSVAPPVPGAHGQAAHAPASSPQGAGLAATAAAAASVAPDEGASRPLLPLLSEDERRTVREASEAARAAHAASQAERAARRARAGDPEAQPVPGIRAGATVYALVGAPQGDRGAAEAQLGRLKSGASMMPYRNAASFEVLPSEDGRWRAAWFPFVDRSAAERTRQMLAKRGVTVELVEF